MSKRVVIIGGGVAGMQCAITLKDMGANPIVIEQDDVLGGKVRNWDRLFPTFTPAEEVLNSLVQAFCNRNIEYKLSRKVVKIDAEKLNVTIEGGEVIKGDAIVIASGFELFDARLKEEYGYGLYDNVITSAELEKMLHKGAVLTKDGKRPERVAILHCVGSRDEKVGQNHCSRVCCVTGVKQAIEIKQLMPETEVYNFYMDMRMFGPGYEELYRSSQQDYGVNHIRGKISEASTTIDGKIRIKAEDTLIGRPLRMSVDMLVLLVGMCAGASNEKFAADCSLEMRASEFLKPVNSFESSNLTTRKGIFLAGTAKAPKNVSETLHDAVSAAYHVINEL